MKVPAALRQKVMRWGRYRCGYCLISEELLGMPMSIDHIRPLTLGGATIEENLCLACRRCNEHKGARVEGSDLETGNVTPFFNPRLQKWDDHFIWSQDGTLLVGKTATGRATITALKMNHPAIVVSRRLWVSVGWWPPIE